MRVSEKEPSQRLSPAAIASELATKGGGRRCFEVAAAWLAAASVTSLLAPVFSSQRRLDRFRELVSGIDHVGFGAPRMEPERLLAAARAAGFVHGHSSFPSTVLARELAQLLGLAQVPATIFKARGVSAAGAPIAVELFMPDEPAPQAVGEVVRKGFGAHVAFKVANSPELAEARAIFQEEGFRVPAFLRDTSALSSLENLALCYFDAGARDPGLRIEICHDSTA